MSRKKTHEEFLEEFTKKFNKEYVVNSRYVNSRTKISVTHKCSEDKTYTWETLPGTLLIGKGCKLCTNKKLSDIRRKTHSSFCKDIKKIYKDEYKVVGRYTKSADKVLVRHSICGQTYEPLAMHLLSKNTSCPYCNSQKMSKDRRLTHEDYIQKVLEAVGDDYTVLSQYTKSSAKITIRHNSKVCGHYIWETKANSFLYGCSRCPVCRGCKKNIIKFKNEVLDLVGNEYSVIEDKYKGNSIKIKMRHNSEQCNFNEFLMSPNMFIRGNRCPKCASSKGEKRVFAFLKLQKISCQEQCRFDNCKNKKPLPFDFAVFNPDKTLNCLIEYDGKQHFEPVSLFGGEKGFKKRQHNDQIKTQYCKDNNIKLIRIPYWDFDNIEDILNEELKDLINSEHCTQQAS